MKASKGWHKAAYCEHCQDTTIICGNCGNNCCNGGYGEVPGPEPYTMMQCPHCKDAYNIFYELYKKEDNGNI